MKERGLAGVFYCSVVLLVCGVLLPSCAKKRSEKEQGFSTVDQQQEHLDLQRQKDLILQRVIEQEAMLINIPIPLYDERVLPASLDDGESHTIVLCYKSPLNLQQLCDFFMSQMERLGWKHLVSFDSYEKHIIFENPDSYCLIMIKEADQRSSFISLYIKRASF